MCAWVLKGKYDNFIQLEIDFLLHTPLFGEELPSTLIFGIMILGQTRALTDGRNNPLVGELDRLDLATFQVDWGPSTLIENKLA